MSAIAGINTLRSQIEQIRDMDPGADVDTSALLMRAETVLIDAELIANNPASLPEEIASTTNTLMRTTRMMAEVCKTLKEVPK